MCNYTLLWDDELEIGDMIIRVGHLEPVKNTLSPNTLLKEKNMETRDFDFVIRKDDGNGRGSPVAMVRVNAAKKNDRWVERYRVGAICNPKDSPSYAAFNAILDERGRIAEEVLAVTTQDPQTRYEDMLFHRYKAYIEYNSATVVRDNKEIWLEPNVPESLTLVDYPLFVATEDPLKMERHYTLFIGKTKRC